jgi:hypothetical protein
MRAAFLVTCRSDQRPNVANNEDMRTMLEQGVGVTEGLVALAALCMLLLCLLA